MNFPEKIKKIIKEAGYDYKIRSWDRGDYIKVVVYAGKSIEKLATKRSRKLVAWKENGKWQGDMDVVKSQGGKGDFIYLMDYHDKTEPLKYEMFSDLDWDDDEKYAKNQLLKI